LPIRDNPAVTDLQWLPSLPDWRSRLRALANNPAAD
jgi:hypothetical protein